MATQVRLGAAPAPSVEPTASGYRIAEGQGWRAIASELLGRGFGTGFLMVVMVASIALWLAGDAAPVRLVIFMIFGLLGGAAIWLALFHKETETLVDLAERRIEHRQSLGRGRSELLAALPFSEIARLEIVAEAGTPLATLTLHRKGIGAPIPLHRGSADALQPILERLTADLNS